MNQIKIDSQRKFAQLLGSGVTFDIRGLGRMENKRTTRPYSNNYLGWKDIKSIDGFQALKFLVSISDRIIEKYPT